MKTIYLLNDGRETKFFASPETIADYIRTLNPANNKFENRTNLSGGVESLEISGENLAKALAQAKAISKSYTAEIMILQDFGFQKYEVTFFLTTAQMYE